MIAASEPVQRPPDARLLVVDALGRITHGPRTRIATLLQRGDVLVANDAATLPASLAGIHAATGARIEVRLAQRASLDADDIRDFSAVIFGEGDYRTPTEDRPAPPSLAPEDVLLLGPLRATVRSLLGHPRFAALRFEGSTQHIWHGLATHGRPIQYAYMRPCLELWDVWSPIAGAPVAFEPPSAGFALDWKLLADLRARGVQFATITHAAGISSTGDEALDARLPLDEPYVIPAPTVEAIAQGRAHKARVIAVGTSVVRALEAASTGDGRVRAGAGIATQRIGPATRLRIVDAVLSGTHAPGSTHHALLGAFADAQSLREVDRELEAHGYRTHEFGDSVLIERRGRRRPASPCPRDSGRGLAHVTVRSPAAISACGSTGDTPRDAGSHPASVHPPRRSARDCNVPPRVPGSARAPRRTSRSLRPAGRDPRAAARG
jgi:S-adenosylmethionine:tRNA ribosyltransferase-isomerase